MSSPLRRTGGLAVVLASVLCLLAGVPAADAAGTHLADNCMPAASSDDGTMVFNRRDARGDFDAYVGDGACNGQRLLPAWDGHRGASDMTADGRYVILTTAVGWDKHMIGAQPGKGSQNAIELLDRRTGSLKTLVPAACKGCERGTLWPRLSPDGKKLTWAEMVLAPFEYPMSGRWKLHVADLDLAAGKLSNDRSYEDPTNPGYAIYEPYGWVPGTNDVVFMSTSKQTGVWTKQMQLFTLPDTLPRTAPKRISPETIPAWSWQKPHNSYHEFAFFKPGDPHTLYTSMGDNTVGGSDVFAYDMRTANGAGLLGQPRRVSYFGGDLNANRGAAAMPGYPKPRMAFVIGMAWVDGGWSAGVCRDRNCQYVDAWRVTDAG